MADGANVQVSAGLDPAALAQITSSITASITAGFERGFSEIKGMFAQLASGAVKDFGNQLDKALNGNNSQGFKKTAAEARELNTALSNSAKESLAFANAYKEISASLTGLSAAISKQSAEVRAAATSQNSALITSSNERVAILRNEGKLAAIEAQSTGQLQLREARTAGQQRVQITRSVLETIGRLEKGLGATLAGAARTSVSAVGKVFETLKSVVTRGDREAFSSTTLNNSLHERETEIRSSFNRQTSAVRESITRQEAAMRSLHESTQKGVIGQVSNATLLGGLGVGFAALAALKSTFTIGADFTRGLAVLKSSLDLTDDQMKKVRATSIALGNDITLPGVSALDAAQAIQVLTKQFGSLGPAAVDAAQAAAKGTLQLTRAAGSSAEDAGALIGSAVNVFKVSADDAVFAADSIAGALTRAAGVGFSDFKDSFVQGATVFEQFVGPAESAKDTLLDFNTTLAILAKNGITGSNAGAGLKQFFIQATQNTKGATKASKELADRAGVTGNVFFDASGKARHFSDSVEILRKGVVGLTDEARNQTLGDLFGARSITVANALINSTGESFGKLREQIAKQGIAAAIAKAQNQGFAGALDAVKSIVETIQIQLFDLVNGPLGKVTLKFAELANTILNGPGPAMHQLRIAIVGVLAGLGGLLALKAAVEVVGLLGKFAALALTPMGLLVIAFAGVGAAAAFFIDKFGGVQGALAALNDQFGGVASKIKDAVLPVFQTVSDFITGTAIPTASRWAGIVGRDLKGAFEASVGFVQETALPALQRFGDVISRDVFPVIAAGAGIVSNALVTAAGAVSRFAVSLFQDILPVLQPAIDGFKSLGSAIAGFFSGGGFSQLGSGFASAGQGIGQTFATIGVNIFNALKPIAKTVANFFVSVFSIENLSGALDAVGKALNIVAFHIANIITDPKFIAGLAIGAAVLLKIGVTLAASLISGVARGIGNNLPQLLHDAWELAVKFAFDPKVLLIAIGGVLAIIEGRQIFQAFQTMGTSGAGGFLAAFKSKVSGAGGFLAGLLQPASQSQFVAENGLIKDFNKQLLDARNKARALGGTRLYDSSQSGLALAKADIARLSTGLSDARIRGLEFRDKMLVAGRGIAGVFAGGGEIGKGIGQIAGAFGRAGADAATSLGGALRRGIPDVLRFVFGDPSKIANAGTTAGTSLGTKLGEGLTNAKNSILGGVERIFSAIKTAAAESGLSTGQLIVKGITGAAVGAIAIAGGIAAGGALGKAQGAGDKLQALGGLAAASLAIGAINPVAGIATAGIGLLTAAFTSGGEAAKKYKQDVDNVTKELTPKLVEAVNAGKISLQQLRDGITFKDIGGQDIAEPIKAIIDALDTGSLKRLDQFGHISFAEAFTGIIESGKGTKQVAADVRTSLLDMIANSEEFKTKFGANAAAAAREIAKIIRPGGKEQFSGTTVEGLPISQEQTGTIRSIISLINDVTGAVNSTGDGLENSRVKAIALGRDGSDAANSIFAAFKKAGEATDSIKNFAGEAARNGRGISFSVAADQAQTAAVTAISDGLGEINHQKDIINAKFAEGILPSGVTATQDAVNTALISVQGLGKAVDELNANKEITPAFRDAEIQSQLKTFSADIQTALASGVQNGDVLTADDARTLLQPIVDEATTGAAPETAAAFQKAFEDLVVHFTPTIDENTAATSAQAALAAAQNLLANSPIIINTSPIPVPELAPGWVADVGALMALPDLPAPVVPNPIVPASWTTNAESLASVGGSSIGIALGAGLVTGIGSKTAAVTAAASALAAAATATANKRFGVQSPSKVFQKIGQQVVDGLILGIHEGTGDIEQSMTDAVQKGIDAATGAVSAATKALRAGGSSLFSALFGSDSVVGQSDFGSLQGGITQSFNALGGAIDSSFNQAADVLKRSATEALSRADLDILGESATSLSPNDVLGAGNRAALASTVDNILGLGKKMIEVGVPADRVTDTVQKYIDHTKALAVQYGLNAGDVDALVESMGLGEGALASFVDTSARLASALGQTTTSAKALNDTAIELFKNLTSGADVFKSVRGEGLAEDARAKITSGFATIAGAADAADQRAKAILDSINGVDASGKALEGGAKPLSLADQLALNQGLNGRSINTTDQFGIANRAAFETALGNIKDLGEALIAGGSSAGYATGEIRSQINALEDYATSLGFNRDQIEDLVTKSGLGDAALASFVQSVADAQTIADRAARAQGVVNQNLSAGLPIPGGLPGGPNAFTPEGDAIVTANPTELVRNFTVNQYLPYGDPQAIALATANGVAQLARLPGT